MAATWVSITYPSSGTLQVGDMGSVYNGVGSGATVKVHRIRWINASALNVGASRTEADIRRVSGVLSTGVTVTPVKYDTASAALDANITCGAKRGFSSYVTLKRLIINLEEVTTTEPWDKTAQLAIPFSMLWSYGYQKSNIPPLTLGEGYGVSTWLPYINIYPVTLFGHEIEFSVT